ncbi:MAG TPA: apolipoprotein N-acyltransferase, partial [Rheinheimera sp.]|uniref:apolipoprotein N-acyltransferase n=1 Tax=Rheinheimera sp. TaxID=1869214 RepID=UPI002B4A633D
MLLSKTTWFPALLLAGLGALNTLAFAPFTYHMLPLLTLSVLAYCLLQAQNPKQAAIFGYAYGLGWFGVGISWVHVSIATFGGMPLIASLAIMALLIGYLALFPALAIWFSWRFRGNFWYPLVLASSWFIAENIRSWFLTGFPWLSVGYSQTDGWMAPWAPVIGETGISFLMLLIAGSVAVAVQRKLWVWPAIAAIVLIVSPALSTIKGWQETGEQVKVALVQGNIAQDLRWDPEQEAITMRKYMELSRPHLNADIMIWPEAAIPQLEPLALAYLFNLDMLAAENNTAVVTGILDYKENGDAYNGMIVLGKSGKEATGGDYRYNTSNRYQK